MQGAQFELHAEIEEQHWWFVARRQILSDVIRAVLPTGKNPAFQRPTIIDVGCGTGANLASLANEYECLGIDTSAEAIRLARSRFPSVTFVQGYAPRDLGSAIERARLVLVSDVLEHVPDDFSLLSELLAAAQPGTYFLLTVPAELALWSEHDRAFGHYRRYDMERFRAMWRGLGVHTVFDSYYNTRLYPVVKSIRTWNRWRKKSAGAAGTDFNMPGPLANRLLTACFAGERHRLVRLARGEHVARYRRGVSLIALLQRTALPVEPRSKPQGVASDYFDPVADMLVGAT